MNTGRLTECFIQCIILALCFGSSAGTGYNVGREFVLAFMEHMQTFSTLSLRVTTAETRNVTVSVDVPLKPSLAVSTVTVTSNKMATVPVHISAMLVGDGVQPLGVHVISDGDIAVQAFSYNTNLFVSSGAFLALPVLTGSSQGRFFVLVAYRETYEMTMAVTTSFSNTRVSITFRLSSGYIRLNNANFYNGDVFQTTLNAYEALHIMTTNSMTGTQIVTNESVSVFMGADGTKVGTVSSDDHMAEQIPPVEAMGIEYVIVNFPGGTDTDYVIVAATEDATSYTIGGTSATLATVGDHNTHAVSSLTAAIMLTSDKPVVVGQVSRSRKNTFGDPALLILPPLAPGRDGLPVGVVLSEAAYLTMVAESACLPALSLNTDSLGAWQQVTGDASLRWTVSSLSEGPHTLRGAQACSRFTAHVAHWALKEGAVHPLYWNLAPIPSSSLLVEPTSTVDVISSAASNYVITTSSSAGVISSEVSSLSTEAGVYLSSAGVISSEVSSLSTEADVFLSSAIAVTSLEDSSSTADEPSVSQVISAQVSSVFLQDSAVISSAVTRDTSAGAVWLSTWQYSTAAEVQSSIDESITPQISASTGVTMITSGQAAAPDVMTATSIVPSQIVASLSWANIASSTMEFGDSMQISPSPDQLETTTVMSETAASSRTAYSSTFSAVSPTSTAISATQVAAQFSSTAHASTEVPERSSPRRCSCGCNIKSMTSLSTVSQQSTLSYNLAVNKSLLSATRRRLQSVPDHRPSAVIIGMTSVVILAVLTLTVVLPDVMHAIAELVRYRARREVDTKI